MSFATIDELRESLAGPTPKAADYSEKMLHPIPAAPTVDRVAFLLKRATDRRVLEFGASGPEHEQVRAVASAYCGVDRQSGDQVVGFDLDDVTQDALPGMVQPDLIICGEVLEHLSNPGWFLTRLNRQFPDVPVIITAPNAFSAIARRRLEQGLENVNRDHVAWYSYRTLRTLVERVGYTVLDWAWYHGEPLTAEGLVLVVV